MAVRRAKAAGLDGNRVLDLGIWVIIAALVGAKALLFIVDFEHFTSSWTEFTLAAALGRRVLRRADRRGRGLHLPAAEAPAAAVDVGRPVRAGHCAGLHGRPPGLPDGRAAATASRPMSAWAITFTDPAAALNVGTPLNVPLHPTQLYESAAGLVIFLLLMAFERRGRPFAGRTFWMFVLLYAVSRFIIEFYRGDDRGLVFDMVSTSQFISLVLAPLSLFMLWYLGRPTQPAAPPRCRAARESRGSRDTICSFDRLPPDSAGERLDRFLAGEMPDYSRSQIQRLIDEGHVDRCARQGDQVQRAAARGRRDCRHAARPGGGHAAPRRICRSRSSSTTPTWSWSTSRPAWSCIPAAGNPDGTLVNALLHHVEEPERHRRRGPAGHRPSPRQGHVSGVMVVAKNDVSHQRAVAAVPRSRGREGIRRAGVGAGAAAQADRGLDRPRPEEPAEDVDARRARPRSGDARHLGAGPSRAVPAAGHHRHRAHAPDPRALERHRASDRRRRAVRRRAPARAARSSARCSG